MKHTALSTRIVQWLKQEITLGHIEEGGRLPSEKELCEQFQVSRSVVREAISQLKSAGLVSSHQGRGVFVHKREQHQSFRLEPPSLHDQREVTHIIELLVAVESASARYAAKRRNEDDLRKIRRELVGMEYAILNDLSGEEHDYAFHQAIVEATRNPHFVALSEYFEQHVRRIIRQARKNTMSQHQDLVAAVQKEHEAIYHAIEKGCPASAADAAERHLRNAARRLNIYLAD
ncbi:FadR/GntR family transcriptional regulator [Castellaniella sp.]|uniref:FadR/GntR family transcriptional regulator n=1 Tax=Castellaniella sp. TaxID=1955812 RepID=UPI0035607F23